MNKGLKAVFAVAVAVIIACGGFLGGFVMGRSGTFIDSVVPEASASTSKLDSRLNEVRQLLQKEALNPPSETSATAGVIQGLLDATGDKYAMYFDKRHFQYFSEESAGEFGGIGVVLGEKDGSTYIVEVYKGSPASKAGIKIGDIFHTIDGVTRAKWTSDEVVKRVRGEKGTTVKLVMVRPAKDAAKPAEKLAFTVTRDLITVPNVVAEMKGDVGYIRLGQFNAKSADEIRAEIGKLDKKGAKSFVLDLRDNPGGLLEQAVDVSSLFVSSGVIVKVEERGKLPVELRATGEVATGKPLVVLINENSASASEIFAGAMQDYGRAKLVGIKSFGKGSVQTIEQLSFGGAVKFTTAHYLTPKDRAINGKGLTPDVVVKMDAEKQADAKTDIQLAKALELAKQESGK